MVDWEKSRPGSEPPPQLHSPPAYYPPPPGWGYPPYGMLPPHLKPSNHIGWAIAALLTFWPLGIPALISSTKVDDLWFRGDAYGAQQASADARKYGIIAVSIAGGLFVLFLLWFGFLLTAFASVS